jgi:hypothetical protein
MSLLFLLNGCHIHFAEMFRSVKVFVQCVAGVDWVELFSRIFSSIFEDDFLATWVFWSS